MDKIAIIKQLLAENPRSGSTWFLLGTEYTEQGQLGEALQAFSEALKYSDDELRLKVLDQLGKFGAGTGHHQTIDKPAPKQSLPDGDLQARQKFMNDDEAEDEYEEDREEFEGEGDEPLPDNVVPFRVFDGGRSQQGSDLAGRAEETISFKDVGGLEQLKNTIRMKIIKPFTDPGLFTKFKKKTGGGILLYGPPGCGKTFIARATAGECGARFKVVHITDILDPYIGVSEQNLKDIFTSARAHKPCVLFFDEVDAIGYNRAKSGSHHLRPLVDQLLTEMEGIDTSTEKLLIIGATNMPWDVDPAFKRPGRFDKMVFVPPPDEKARELIFRLKLADKPMDAIDFSRLAGLTELYSGADIENVVEVATEKVISEIMQSGQERSINMRDLTEAVSSTRPSTVDWLRTVKNYVKYANQSGLYDDVEQFLNKYKKVLSL